MKVVEVRNLCLSYDKRVCNDPANWAGLFVIKQILRNIQIKMMKSSINETELWIPENIVKGIEKAWPKPENNNGNNGGRR